MPHALPLSTCKVFDDMEGPWEERKNASTLQFRAASTPSTTAWAAWRNKQGSGRLMGVGGVENLGPPLVLLLHDGSPSTRRCCSPACCSSQSRFHQPMAISLFSLDPLALHGSIEFLPSILHHFSSPSVEDQT